MIGKAYVSRVLRHCAACFGVAPCVLLIFYVLIRALLIRDRLGIQQTCCLCLFISRNYWIKAVLKECSARFRLAASFGKWHIGVGPQTHVSRLAVPHVSENPRPPAILDLQVQASSIVMKAGTHALKPC